MKSATQRCSLLSRSGRGIHPRPASSTGRLLLLLAAKYGWTLPRDAGRNPASSARRTLKSSYIEDMRAAVGGRTLRTNTKIARSGDSLMRRLMTKTNCPTVRSAGTRYFFLSMSGTSVFCARSTMTCARKATALTLCWDTHVAFCWCHRVGGCFQRTGKGPRGAAVQLVVSRRYPQGTYRPLEQHRQCFLASNKSDRHLSKRPSIEHTARARLSLVRHGLKTERVAAADAQYLRAHNSLGYDRDNVRGYAPPQPCDARVDAHP